MQCDFFVILTSNVANFSSPVPKTGEKKGKRKKEEKVKITAHSTSCLLFSGRHITTLLSYLTRLRIRM